MPISKQLQALTWLAGVLTVFLSALFSFNKYLYLRNAGEAGGDAAFFMVLMFIGILVMATIIYGTMHYFLVPESISAYRGFIRIRNKGAIMSEEEEQQTALLKDEEQKQEPISSKQAAVLREQEEMLQTCIEYANATFQNLLTPEELEILTANIIKFSKAECDYSTIDNKALDNVISTSDLMHLGWNIGKRLISKESKRKLGAETAEFLKKTFTRQLTESEHTTLASKLTNNDGRYSIEIIKPAKKLTPFIFPPIEKKSE